MPKLASEQRKKKMHPWALAAPIQPNYPTIYKIDLYLSVFNLNRFFKP